MAILYSTPYETVRRPDVNLNSLLNGSNPSQNFLNIECSRRKFFSNSECWTDDYCIKVVLIIYVHDIYFCSIPEGALVEYDIWNFLRQNNLLQEHHFSLLQRELEKLRNDIEKMRSELRYNWVLKNGCYFWVPVSITNIICSCRYEVDKLTAGQRLDLNLERGWVLKSFRC